MLKLFHAWGSCSLASALALSEAGADFELVVMSTRTGEQRTADYLAINPKGRVPALVTPKGVLTETPAILSWIPETYPAARLLPEDAWDRAQAHAFNSYLCSTVHVAHAHKHRGYRWADEESSFADMTRKVAANEIACFELIDAEMFRSPWVLGEAFSVCDLYLFTLFGWLEGDGVDTSRFPRLLDHSRRVAERPAVREILAREAA